MMYRRTIVLTIIVLLLSLASLAQKSVSRSPSLEVPSQPNKKPAVATAAQTTPQQAPAGEDHAITDIYDWVKLLGGIVGLVGGLAGFISWLAPPRLLISRTDYLGVVNTRDRSTPNVHLPIVITNLSKKPAVITFARLLVKNTETGQENTFDWSLFWRVNAHGLREAERRSSPIPIQGLTNVERNIEFGSNNTMQWQEHLYEITLELRAGRMRKLRSTHRFYTKPSHEHCDMWYNVGVPNNPQVYDLAIFDSKGQVPTEGC